MVERTVQLLLMEPWRRSCHMSLLSGQRTEFLHPLWIYTLDLVLCPLPVPCSDQTNGASKLSSLSLSGFRNKKS